MTKMKNMETVELKVEGMDCGGCVKSVTRMLCGVPGVAEFRRAVERAGFKAP